MTCILASKIKVPNQTRWCAPIITIPRRLRQEDLKIETSLDCLGRSCLKKKSKRGKKSTSLISTITM
jgi:hypothetical protein